MSETDVAEYKQETQTSDSFLDPHHTHFILVDNEEQGSEIDFRSKFESRELYTGNNTLLFYNIISFYYTSCSCYVLAHVSVYRFMCRPVCVCIHVIFPFYCL